MYQSDGGGGDARQISTRHVPVSSQVALLVSLFDKVSGDVDIELGLDP